MVIATDSSDERLIMQRAILATLGRGKQEALPGRLLAQRLGERSTRQIRREIIELVVQGNPICGRASNGYFIAETAEECEECLGQLMSYLKMIARHHKYLQRASRALTDPHQVKMRF